MSTDFSRILALLRKEKGISQKQVAQDLSISQALLSHYEKGIRKPGLEFLVKCADYYQVSCDYLLGRSPDRQGATLVVEDIPEPEEAGKGNQGVQGVLTQLNKKLIANSQNILFDMLTVVGSKELTGEVSSYLMLAVYQAFRIVYSSNPKNPADFFSVPEQASAAYINAAMQMVQAQAQGIANGKPLSGEKKIAQPEKLSVTTESLAEEYPLFASSLLNLIQSAESKIGYGEKKKK